MPDDNSAKPRSGGRPRSKSFLRISLENPYAQLKVSPNAPTNEIANRISALTTEAKRRVRAKVSKSDVDPDEREILRLQKIDEQIGDPSRRKLYDEKHPQNIMLTVQPIVTEQSWTGHRKAGLISEWLHDELGETAFLPTPSCERLWVPAGMEPETLEFLTQYLREDSSAQQAPVVGTAMEESAVPSLSLTDLERFIKEG